MLNVLLVALFFAVHPVHVSLASIEYVPEKETFDIFVKVWKDDYASDFVKAFGKPPELDFVTNGKVFNEDAQMYVNEKIQILADQKRLTGVIENIEADDIEVKIYMSFKFKGDPDEITIRNFIMTELYNDQSNMLIFKYKNIEEGIKFTSLKKEQIFTLK